MHGRSKMLIFSSFSTTMGRKSQLSSDVRSQARILREEGYSLRNIAQRLGCSSATNGKILQRYKTPGSCEIRRRTGRPRKLTKSVCVMLERIVNKEPTATSIDLRRTNSFLNDVSLRTIRRQLAHDCKLRTRKARSRPLLSSTMRSKRLAWCKQHETWSAEQWRMVICSLTKKNPTCIW